MQELYGDRDPDANLGRNDLRLKSKKYQKTLDLDYNYKPRLRSTLDSLFNLCCSVIGVNLHKYESLHPLHWNPTGIRIVDELLLSDVPLSSEHHIVCLANSFSYSMEKYQVSLKFLDHACIHRLVQVSLLNLISHLDLSKSNLNCSMGKALSLLRLDYCSFADTQWGDEGMFSLLGLLTMPDGAAACGWSTLTEWNLENTKITTKSLRLVKWLTNLKFLNLSNTQICQGAHVDSVNSWINENGYQINNVNVHNSCNSVTKTSIDHLITKFILDIIAWKQLVIGRKKISSCFYSKPSYTPTTRLILTRSSGSTLRIKNVVQPAPSKIKMKVKTKVSSLLKHNMLGTLSKSIGLTSSLGMHLTPPGLVSLSKSQTTETSMTIFDEPNVFTHSLLYITSNLENNQHGTPLRSKGFQVYGSESVMIDDGLCSPINLIQF